MSIQSILFLFIILFSSSSILQAQEKRPIKKQLHWNYTVEANQAGDQKHLSLVTEFNTEGKRTQTTVYNNKEQIIQRYAYEQEQQQEIGYWELTDGTKVKREANTYNSDGSLSSKQRYEANGNLIDHLEFEYDETGLLKTEIAKTATGTLLYKIDKRYKGQFATEAYQNFQNQESMKGVTTFNANGQAQKYEQYLSTGTGALVKRINYTYNETQQLSKKVIEVFDKNSPNSTQQQPKRIQTEIYTYKDDQITTKIYQGKDEGRKLIEYTVLEYVYYQ